MACAKRLRLSLLIDSITFGLVVAFIIFGLIGIVVPLIPGTLLIWIAVLIYEIVNDFGALGAPSFAVITVIALVTGTADLWMPLLGAKSVGASKRALLLGVVGSVVGTFVAPLLGTIIGYAVGILLGEYHKRGDWHEAFRASVGGVAGWGVATAIQLGGGLLMLLIFAWKVLAA
jgi:uncharacterized protein YqgC (DUF456 family)